MDLEAQKNTLLEAVQQQYQDNVAALEANRRLADEKTSYQNEARGTYYSGIPTWERAQTAVEYGNKMNELNSNLQKAQNSIWSNIESYMDKINAYNEAAKSGGGGTTATGGTGYSTNLADYYTTSNGYQFKDPNGNKVRAATWASKTGKNVWDVVKEMAAKGDANAIHALAGYNNANKELTAEEVAAFNILGISTEGYGRRD